MCEAFQWNTAPHVGQFLYIVLQQFIISRSFMHNIITCSDEYTIWYFVCDNHFNVCMYVYIVNLRPSAHTVREPVGRYSQEVLSLWCGLKVKFRSRLAFDWWYDPDQCRTIIIIIISHNWLYISANSQSSTLLLDHVLLPQMRITSKGGTSTVCECVYMGSTILTELISLWPINLHPPGLIVLARCPNDMDIYVYVLRT